MTNALRGFFLEFQLSEGIVVEVPHRVLTLFHQYKLAFANHAMDAYRMLTI